MGIGIYMIQNMCNNKVYIGQSIDIERRWNDHKYKLNNNKHENLHLQDSFNKYGESNFVFSILCECETDQLNDLEIYYIDKYKSYNSKYGYNLTFGGDYNFAFNDDTIIKMRKSHQYEYVSVLQYSLDKEFICKYESLSDASRAIKGTPSGIRNCANRFSYGIGSSKTYKGYFWVYEYDVDKFKKCDVTKYLKQNLSYPVNKYEYPSGRFIKQYDTVLDASIDNNISSDVISMCVRGVQKQSGGFTYRNANKIIDKKDIYIDIKIKKKSSKKVVAFDMKTNEIVMILDSLIEAKNLGYHTGHISQCCNNKRKSYKGYYWKYFDENGIKEIEQKSLSDL